MNIVFPMAGRGERFSRNGFRHPKPLIPVLGKPIIQHVLECFHVEANYFFIVREEHIDMGLEDVLLSLRPAAHIVPLKHVTEGPACTVLQVRDDIDTDQELLIADCDSVLVWPDRWVFDWFRKRGATGGVTLRITDNPACSFAALDGQGWVMETREKDPFTRFSTTGPFWWRCGRDFIRAAETMISEKRTVNGEYYVSPTYNYHIAEGGRVQSYFLPEFWSLGTPNDVEAFVQVRTRLSV